jgi:hypothetical protein
MDTAFSGKYYDNEGDDEAKKTEKSKKLNARLLKD